MVTRKSSRPAGRGHLEEEVKSEYHDDVLNWLIDNLSTVVGDRWGLDDESLNEAVKNARKSGTEWVQDTVCSALKEYAEGKRQPEPDRRAAKNTPPVQLSESTQLALSDALRRADAVKKRVSTFIPSKDTGNASLTQYEVMMPVCRVEARPSSSDKRVEAGYVDLVASIFLPSELEFQIDGIEVQTGSYRYLLRYPDSEADLQKMAQSFAPPNVNLSVRGVRRQVWMSVRTGSFTLGEILQELKALRALEDRSQFVALVVDGIDSRMFTNIEREGFVVIDKRDY